MLALISPALPCDTSSFSADQVIAFSEGRVSDCFGETFRATDQHVRTPTIARGRMLLIDEVTTFDPVADHGGAVIYVRKTTSRRMNGFLKVISRMTPACPEL